MTITHARDVVRAVAPKASEDIVVRLKGGLYPIRNEVEFTGANSGQNGHGILYENMPGETPVLDGGVAISGWRKIPRPQIQFAPTATGTKPEELEFYETQVERGTDFRHLYVNGVKAVRARSDDASFLRPTPDGFGFDQNWLTAVSDPAALEIVATPREWQQSRLPVLAAESHTLRIKLPCWDIVSRTAYPGYANPSWLKTRWSC